MKSFLLVISAGLLLALVSATPAAAATPCWKALINDWYDGRIDQTYPRACYTDAIRHLPQDVETYSSAKDDIQRALFAAARHPEEPPTWNPNDGSTSGNSTAEGGSKGLITQVIEWLGPSNAASVPLPLLILAGVAFLLLAAAGGSFVNRRIQERRLPPPPA